MPIEHARLRREPPPADTAVVVRGGLHSLDHARLVEHATDSMLEFGFYGVSVFIAEDRAVLELCLRVPRLRTPGTLWVAEVGSLRGAGFALAPTGESPHFDIVLPDVAPGTIERVRACFAQTPNPARRRR